VSVRPVAIHPDGSIDVVFDELGHSGTIAAAEIVWATDPTGNQHHKFILLHCPDGCGATSTHPAGGGAAPREVQQLFVDKTKREGCVCGQVVPTDNTTALPESHVHLNCDRMDGADRWRLDTPAQVEARLAREPQMFQVVYRRADRLIVGLEPSGGVGANNGVAVIFDLSQYDVLLDLDPAYLSADGNSIQGTPP
jgi:hypothetical protein